MLNNNDGSKNIPSQGGIQKTGPLFNISQNNQPLIKNTAPNNQANPQNIFGNSLLGTKTGNQPGINLSSTGNPLFPPKPNEQPKSNTLGANTSFLNFPQSINKPEDKSPLNLGSKLQEKKDKPNLNLGQNLGTGLATNLTQNLSVPKNKQIVTNPIDLKPKPTSYVPEQSKNNDKQEPNKNQMIFNLNSKNIDKPQQKKQVMPNKSENVQMFKKDQKKVQQIKGFEQKYKLPPAYDRKLKRYRSQSLAILDVLETQNIDELSLILEDSHIRRKILENLKAFSIDELKKDVIKKLRQSIFDLSPQALRNIHPQNIPMQVKQLLSALIDCISRYLQIDYINSRDLLDVFMRQYDYMDQLIDDGKLNRRYFQQKQILVKQNNNFILNQQAGQVKRIKKHIMSNYIRERISLLKVINKLMTQSIQQQMSIKKEYFKQLLKQKINISLWQSYTFISKLKTPFNMKPLQQLQWIVHTYKCQQFLLYLLQQIHLHFNKQVNLKDNHMFVKQIIQTIDQQNYKGSYNVFRKDYNLTQITYNSQKLILNSLMLDICLIQPAQLKHFYTHDILSCFKKLKSQYSQPFKALIQPLGKIYGLKGQFVEYYQRNIFTYMKNSSWKRWLDFYVQKVVRFQYQIQFQTLVDISKLLKIIIKEQGKSYWVKGTGKNTVTKILNYLINFNGLLAIQLGICMMGNANQSNIQYVIEYFGEMIIQNRRINAINNYIYMPLNNKIVPFIYDRRQDYYTKMSALEDQENIQQFRIQIKFITRAVQLNPQIIFTLQQLMINDLNQQVQQINKSYGGRYLIFFILDLFYYFQHKYSTLNFSIINHILRAINSLLRYERTRQVTCMLIAIYSYLGNGQFMQSVHPLLSILENLRITQNSYLSSRNKTYQAVLEQLQILLNFPYVFFYLPDESMQKLYRWQFTNQVMQKRHELRQANGFNILQEWQKRGVIPFSNWFESIIRILYIKPYNPSPKYWQIISNLLYRLKGSQIKQIQSDNRQENHLFKIIIKMINQINLEDYLLRVLQVYMIDGQSLALQSKYWRDYEDKVLIHQTIIAAMKTFQTIIQLIELNLKLNNNQTQLEQVNVLGYLNILSYFQRHLTSKQNLLTYDIDRVQIQRNLIATMKANIVLVLSSYINFQANKQFQPLKYNYTRPPGCIFYSSNQIYDQSFFEDCGLYIKNCDHSLFYNYMGKVYNKDGRYVNSISAMALRLLTKLVLLWDNPSIIKKPMLHDIISLERNDSKEHSLIYSSKKAIMVVRNLILRILANCNKQEQEASAALDLLISCFSWQKQFLSLFLLPTQANRRSQRSYVDNLEKILTRILSRNVNVQLITKALGFIQLLFSNQNLFQNYVARLRNCQLLYVGATKLLQKQIKPPRNHLLQPFVDTDDLQSPTKLLAKLSFQVESYKQMLLFQSITSLLSLVLSQFMKNKQSLKLEQVLKSIFDRLYSGHWPQIFFKNYKTTKQQITQRIGQINQMLKHTKTNDYHYYSSLKNQSSIQSGRPIRIKLQSISSEFQTLHLTKSTNASILKKFMNCNSNGYGKNFFCQSNELFYQMVSNCYNKQKINQIMFKFHNANIAISLRDVKQCALSSWTQLFIFIASLGQQGYLMSTTQLLKQVTYSQIVNKSMSALSLLSCNKLKIPRGYAYLFTSNIQSTQYFLINFINIIIDTLQTKNSDNNNNIPLTLLGVSLLALSSLKKISLEIKKVLNKMVRNKNEWANNLAFPLTIYCIVQFFSLANKFQIKHNLRNKLFKRLVSNNTQNKKLVLCAYIILQSQSSEQIQLEAISWTLRQLKKTGSLIQTDDEYFCILCRLLLTLIKKSNKAVKNQDSLPNAFTDMQIFKQIPYVSAYKNSKTRNPTHMMWLWALAVLRDYQMNINSQQQIDQSMGNFIRIHFPRIRDVLSAPLIITQQKNTKASLNLATLQQIEITLQVLWHFLNQGYLFQKTLELQLKQLIQILTSAVFLLYTPGINLAYVFLPLSTIERHFNSITCQQKEQSHMLLTPNLVTPHYSTPKFSPFRSTSMKNYSNMSMQQYQPDLFIFNIEMNCLNIAIPALGCIQNIAINISTNSSNQMFKNNSNNIYFVQRFVQQNIIKWKHSANFVNSFLQKLNILNKSVQNSMATILFCSLKSYPNDINALLIQCGITLIFSFETAIAHLKSWKSAHTYWGIESTQYFNQFKKKQIQIICDVQKQIKQYEHQIYQVLNIRSSNYYQQLIWEIENIQ